MDSPGSSPYSVIVESRSPIDARHPRQDTSPAVLIRPYSIADAQSMYDAVRESLADLMLWMPWCHPDYSLDEARSWLDLQVEAFRQRLAFEFAIVSHEGRFLGGCGLNQIDVPNRRSNLGYWVRSTATRRGAATAAVELLRRWAFECTDLVRLEIVIAAGNVASQRVAEKAGAVREGTLHSRLILHDARHDAVGFSFVRPLESG